MATTSQANALSDARVEIARITDSVSEQVLDQQIAYAAGYIRCAQDHMLITVDHWKALTDEIEAENHSWRSRHAGQPK